MKGSGVKQDDFANSAAGNSLSQTGANNAASLYGTLSPELSTMAVNPQGINPADMAKIQTSNMQGAGGSNAAAVGQGSLLAARTKNAGTADAAIAKSNESAGQQLSKDNLSAQTENQQLKNQQQQAGVKGLEGLYGTNEGEALGGLEASNAALKNAGSVPLSFWDQYLLQAQKSASQAAAAGGG